MRGLGRRVSTILPAAYLLAAYVPQDEEYYCGYTRTAAPWTRYLRAIRRHELLKRQALAA